MEGRNADHLTMPVDRESVPPPNIGKIGPYTVFITPKPSDPPIIEPTKLVSPPVQPPPPHFDKSAADEERSFWGFFKDAVNKVHVAHSRLDDHMARWLGLDQSKYQWALDDYHESKGLEKEGLKAKECLNKQQQV
ncbi:hypothetical protein MLD38_014892 [Melastoma candidum]|uniref:Uncharacterized protein n=1 Tax=Melastoma candidum TaxID=119954 RepID=A0ACB9RMR0_9MYRT|nr:hypothetical protein MLD38_014892 [Melastoma candidum]